jgi:hypothetical protein
MTASQKAEFTKRTLMALLTAQADRAELDREIVEITRSLASAHEIPVSYPPVG